MSRRRFDNPPADAYAASGRAAIPAHHGTHDTTVRRSAKLYARPAPRPAIKNASVATLIVAAADRPAIMSTTARMAALRASTAPRDSALYGLLTASPPR